MQQLSDGGTVELDKDFVESGIDSLAAVELIRHLQEETGLALAPFVAFDHPTPKALAAFIEEHLSKGSDAIATDSAIEGAEMFIRSPPAVVRLRASLPPARLTRPLLLVLASPRSGSSLLQLCLNANRELYAGQELWLLMYDTMDERCAMIGAGRTTLDEGLFATLMELLACTLAEAKDFTKDLGDLCPTWRIYERLQELCSPRMLVDKTPGNISHPMIMQRAEELFATPRYLHLVRHPYAAIKSDVELTREFFNPNVTWKQVELSWSTNNESVLDFLRNIAPVAKLSLTYEDLVRDPEAETRRICAFIGVSWEVGMAMPYDRAATEIFQTVGVAASTDPKLLTRKQIDKGLADKWRSIVPPERLQPSTKFVAKLFGYELHPELPEELSWLSRTPAHAPPAVFVHDFTGRLWGLGALTKALRMPCLGIQCSTRLVEGCYSMQELGWRYVRLLPPAMAQQPIRLVAYSLGCRIAYHMACALEQAGKLVQIVLLDGEIRIEPEAQAYRAAVGRVTKIMAEYLRTGAVGEGHLQGARDLDSPSGSSLVEEDSWVAAARPLMDVLVPGSEVAEVSATLLELPDGNITPETPPRFAAMYISAEGTDDQVAERAARHLPGMDRVAVAGGHFDFLQKSANEVAKHINRFFLE
jgi:thioesterase domain-containing protein/acyl carrier protein